MSDQAQRTEKPTPRKLQKARKEGRFPVSREAVAAAQFAAFVALLSSTTPVWIANWREFTRHALESSWAVELTPQSFTSIGRDAIRAAFLPLAVTASVVLAISLAAHLAITGLGFAGSKIAPDFSRLNGFTRLASLPKQAPALLAQTLLVVVVLAFTVRSIAGESLTLVRQLPLSNVMTSVHVLSTTLMSLLWKGVFIFLVVGAIDWFRQRRQYDRQLRMSKQEIREEMKESEGDPQIKARVRRIQRDLARRKQLKDVPTATAVIVNPTHYAVAIRYVHESPGAPVIVAKGKNYIARRIREIAIEHNVPIVENQPLAQALYKAAEVGQEIPAHLYRAVAEILAYIYRLMKGRLPGA